MPTYLTTNQAAALMGVDKRTVRNLANQGLLSGSFQESPKSTWKIPLEAVTRWLEGKTPIGGTSGVASSEEMSGDRITIGDTNRSILAVGRSARVTITQNEQRTELAREFQLIQELVAARPEDPNLDKEELSSAIMKIEEEVTKGEQANPNKVERWLKNMGLMAPDILEVTLATLTGPIPGITAVVRKVAEKAKVEAGKN